MNYYTPEGDFDTDAAAETLRNLSAVTNDNVVRRDLARLQAAALIDIAESLRVLAAESAYAMSPPTSGSGNLDNDLDELPVDDPIDVTEADAGTPVRLLVGNDADEGPRTGILTGNGGISEGMPWVGVHWDDDRGDEDGTPSEVRVFAPHLEVYVPSTSSVDLVDSLSGQVVATRSSIDDEPNGHDLIDEIDSDFYGEHHPVADDALAALKAKSKKKGGKK